MIANKYVTILVLYYTFIDYGIFVSYIQHPMLDFLNKNTISIYNGHKKKWGYNHARISGDFQQFSQYYL